MTIAVHDKTKRPQVGVGVLIWKNGEVLLGKRKGPNGGGEYGWPGGHFEYNESFEDCARREVREETGLEIRNLKFLRLLNFKNTENGRHYADVAFTADWKSGEPEVKEPEKCESWGWYPIDRLPTPLFGPVPTAIDAWKTGKKFYDA